MEDRRFTEIDLRRMLERASDYREDVVKGRWLIETMVTHYDRMLKPLDTYATSYEAMTDQTATSIQKVLPPKKVARLTRSSPSNGELTT
jgi:hypothetical protein